MRGCSDESCCPGPGQHVLRVVRPTVCCRCCMTGKKIVWTMIAVAAAVVIVLVLRAHWLRSISVHRSITIEGAVIQRDADTDKELPIAGVTITASDGVKSATPQSEASGYYKLVLQK